jgi:succinate-acetate transporter protein
VATAWIFGGGVQLIVGILELRDGRLFAGVTFGSYGGFWLSFAFLETLYIHTLPAALHGQATALFLAPWVVFTAYILVGSLRTNRALVLAFLLVEAVLMPLIIGFAAGSVLAIRIGGWAGIALALEVWYIAAAEIVNHQFSRTLLPLGHLAQNQPAASSRP